MDAPRLADIGAQVVRVLDLFYAFGGLIFLLLAVAVGVQWMTSRGDADLIGEARKRLGYLITGFLLFFLSATIVIFIYRALDVKDCLGRTVTPGFNLFFESSCSTGVVKIENGAVPDIANLVKQSLDIEQCRASGPKDAVATGSNQFGAPYLDDGIVTSEEVRTFVNSQRIGTVFFSEAAHVCYSESATGRVTLHSFICINGKNYNEASYSCI